MSATDLSGLPVEDMEKTAQSGDAVWKEVYGMVEFVAPQVSVWRNWEDDQIAPYLDDIAELLIKISEVYPLLKTKTQAAAQ